MKSITQEALERNKVTLTEGLPDVPVIPIKRGRGRPRKIVESVLEQHFFSAPVSSVVVSQEQQPEKKKRGRPRKVVESVLEKCLVDPIDITETSPNFLPNSSATNTVFPDDGIGIDNFGKWKRNRVTETSGIFVSWLRDCQMLVDNHFGKNKNVLDVKSRNKHLHVTMVDRNSHERRSFAFVEKATGDIYVPIVFQHPSDNYDGNITDAATRMSCMTPYGVKSFYSWMPTNENWLPNKWISDD